MLRKLVAWFRNILSSGQKAPTLEEQVRHLSRSWHVSYREAWRVVKRYSFLQDVWMHEAASKLRDLTYEEALRQIGDR